MQHSSDFMLIPLSAVPCPFCHMDRIGYDVVEPLNQDGSPTGDPPRFDIVCENCHASGPVAGTLDEALKLWNDRISLAPTHAGDPFRPAQGQAKTQKGSERGLERWKRV